MRVLTRIVAGFALALALALPALAQGISSAQHEALVARVESFDAAMKANDMAAVMGVVPPRLLEKIAGIVGATTDQLLASMQEQMDEMLKTVKIESFGMDVETAEFVTLADGTVYAMIPTETVLDMGEAGGKIRATSQTLGLLDGETWYLIRVDDPQQAGLVKELYPALADVEFPAGAMEPVTE